MFIHNTTFNIASASFVLWQQWMRNSYLKKSLSLGLFDDHRVLKVHFSGNEQEEIISIQLRAQTKEACERFDVEHLPNFKQELFLAFGEQVLFFTTHLEELK